MNRGTRSPAGGGRRRRGRVLGRRAPGRGRGAGGRSAPGRGARLPLAQIAAALGAGILALAGPGCASPPDPHRPPPGEQEALLRLRERLDALLAAPAPDAPEDALRVILAFEPGADLDLYVTGPRRETVYYAHTPSAIGGELLADHRCDSAGEPMEEVRFRKPPPGPYRVGVDYPEACGGAEPRVRAFAVGIRYGATRWIEAGFLAPREFRVRVLDFELPEEPAGADPRAGANPASEPEPPSRRRDPGHPGA